VTYKKKWIEEDTERELQMKRKGKEVKECSKRWFSWVMEGIKIGGWS